MVVSSLKGGVSARPVATGMAKWLQQLYVCQLDPLPTCYRLHISDPMAIRASGEESKQVDKSNFPKLILTELLSLLLPSSTHTASKIASLLSSYSVFKTVLPQRTARAPQPLRQDQARP